MKKIIILSFLLLSIFSCSDDYLLLGDNEKSVEKTSVTELVRYEDQLSEKIKNIASEGIDADGGGYDPVCIGLCNYGYEDCYDTAVSMRDQDFYACETIRIIGVELVDEYCTRTVIVGYEIIVTPEGEEIRRPIIETEEYVCGQVEQIKYTEDPVLIEEYRNCRIQAIEYFLEEVEKCESKRNTCFKKCKKGPVGPQY